MWAFRESVAENSITHPPLLLGKLDQLLFQFIYCPILLENLLNGLQHNYAKDIPHLASWVLDLPTSKAGKTESTLSWLPEPIRIEFRSCAEVRLQYCRLTTRPHGSIKTYTFINFVFPVTYKVC